MSTRTLLTVYGPHGLLLRLGSVTTQTTADGPQRVLEPDAAPLIDQVCAWLDAQPAPPPRRDIPYHREEYLIAATVCCHWSSQMCRIADAQLPAWPLARRAARADIGRINDSEMRRINIEASQAYATWLTLVQDDHERFLALEAKARHYLTAVRPVPMSEGYKAIIDMFGMHTPPRAGWEARPVRALANALMLHAWRNGPVEDYHAGRFVAPLPLQERRVTPAQAQQLMLNTASRLAALWRVIDEEIMPPTQPLPERARRVIAPCSSDEEWSLDAHTHTVILRGAEPAR